MYSYAQSVSKMQEPTWPIFPYGGDYNPDQWPREVWAEDLRLMKQANVTIATLPVFGWVALNPEEDVYTFEWLDDILGRLESEGIRWCLATATGSVPAWITHKYPDVLATDSNGVRRKHGGRHTFCPHSPNFRRLSVNLARKMAERYGHREGLLAWHISNEYGPYCYCDLCAEAFRTWLKARYGSLDELNRCWYTAFWSHTYTDWAQVEPPYSHGEQCCQALKIDYCRFMSESVLECYKLEKEVLREISPNIPITTNMMWDYRPYDYHKWAKELDFVSWDAYPQYNTDPADTAYMHTQMRGLKEGQPFWLMEQSPSQTNWTAYGRLKPPGLLRSISYQAVAHGADAVMYFQWRRGRGGFEKLHGAFVEHGGDENNRVFKETAKIGAELAQIGTRLQGARVPAKVAVLMDWENWWGVSFSSGPSRDIDYAAVVKRFYKAFHNLGIQVEIVNPSADLSRFEWVVAPMLMMLRESDAESVKSFVANGGTLLTTAYSAFTDETDLVFLNGAPGPWAEMLGIWVEETDSLPPDDLNGMTWKGSKEMDATILAERIHLRGATALGHYTKNFFAGEPAATVNSFGRGKAYYLATFPRAEDLTEIIADLAKEQGIASPLANGVRPPAGVEVTERVKANGERHLYLVHHGKQSANVPLPEGTHRDLLTDETFEGSLSMAQYDVRILVKE